ncbi:hypothetical protein M9Y10_024716 [Tritrichomonas musculus]|uniref:DUF3447 domain-containing protein n=1 Tax=Tritrichomonas musculus TaxID=1915356 RepID=A0ABR2HB22_9EUKA
MNEIVGKLQRMQESLIDYLDDETNSELKFQYLSETFEDIKIGDDKYVLTLLLHLLAKISNNHHRYHNFFSKIEQVLRFFKDNIKKYYSNSEFFHIFKDNKRILLFLIEEEMIIIEKNIAKEISTNDKYLQAKYPEYFRPEIQPFINESWFPKNVDFSEEIPTNFNELRKIGENDGYLYDLIQKDLVKDFISYISRSNYALKSFCMPSIYETNQFLLKKQKVTLIEYAAFFGSIQIFQFLHKSGVQLTQSLWFYAIHSDNADLIHFLEENNMKPEGLNLNKLISESMKCHHNNIANYFQNNYGGEITLISSLKYYNFAFLESDMLNKKSFIDFCKYDYYQLVYFFLKKANIDINQKQINSIIFFNIVSN